MMNPPATAALVFPHQLYAYPDAVALAPGRPVWLLEDPLLFNDAQYPAKHHKLRLVLHRAGMRRYQQEVLEANGHACTYVAYSALRTTPDLVFDALKTAGISEVHVADPTDYLLLRRLRRYAKQHNLKLVVHESPNFLTNKAEGEAFFRGKARFFFEPFYRWQRQQMKVLLTPTGEPVGGQWNFDHDNRAALPKNYLPPKPPTPPAATTWVTEACAYVATHFGDHFGLLPAESETPFPYPTNHAEAATQLDQFLTERFAGFGPYEDAISSRHGVLHHSVLTPALNCGLLSPRQVLTAALAYAETDDTVSLASLEGFVRQLIGWREYVRIVYGLIGSEQRQANYFHQTGRLTAAWYDGTTGLPPVDTVIHRLQRTAYSHHIERLMVMGNLLLLSGLHPNEVYTWFMETHIDAYDWVMVPNVYGMAQFADGGRMMTKPYIAASAYLRKMSDYGPGPWTATADGLFWNFIDRHRALLQPIYRLRALISMFDKLDPAKRTLHLTQAAAFVARTTQP